MIGCFTGGELLTSVSQWEGRERITTDTLWHYSYNLESRRWKMEIDSPQDPIYYFLSLIDLQPSGVGESFSYI